MPVAKKHINLKNVQVEYHVVHSKRAGKPRIAVGREGVEVVLPERAMVDPRVLLVKHADWVLEKRARYRAYRERMPERKVEEGARFPYLGGDRKLKLAHKQASEVSADAFCLSSNRVDKTCIREELEVLYRREARRYFTERVDHFCEVMDVSYEQIQIRNQKTRGGSYSQRTGTLSLNWRLMMASPKIVDYLLVHELAHVKVPNHS